MYIYTHVTRVPYTVHTPVFSLETAVESLVWNPGRNSCFPREVFRRNLASRPRPLKSVSLKLAKGDGSVEPQDFFCEILGEIQRIAHKDSLI